MVLGVPILKHFRVNILYIWLISEENAQQLSTTAQEINMLDHNEYW